MESVSYRFDELWMPPAERAPVVLSQTTAPLLMVVPDCVMADAASESLSRAHSLIGAVARAAVEALTGFRPLSQLTRWLEPSAISGLSLAMRHGDWQGAVIAKVRAETVSDTVIEGVAQLAIPGRRLAIAIRLEWRRGHWACTDLSVLLPGSHLVNRRYE